MATSTHQSPSSSTPNPTNTAVAPTIDQFAEELSVETRWYDLGVFLKIQRYDLKEISRNHQSDGIMRCLMEMYSKMEERGTTPSWQNIVRCLRRMRNHSLANEIHARYVTPSPSQEPSPISSEGSSKPEVSSRLVVPDSIANEFEELTEIFCRLVLDIINAIKTSRVPLNQLQYVASFHYGVTPLPDADATVDKVFLGLIDPYYSVLNYRILIFITETFLKHDQSLQSSIMSYEIRVNAFKKSVEMSKFVDILKRQQHSTGTMVKLKVREFWNEIMMDRFEKVINQILSKVYDYGSQVTIDKGCIIISWIIPSIIADKANIPIEDVEYIQIIGIISLHIGDDMVYDYPGEGCETIEAAMLQAIELKNTRAIELLLAMDCNPEVATYNGDNAVTTIVNIRKSKKSSVDHVCIIGHNEHVKTIVDPNSKPVECSSSNIKEKVVKRLHQENDTLRQEQTTLRQEQTTLRQEQTTLRQEQTTLRQEQSTLRSVTDQLQLSVKAKGD